MLFEIQFEITCDFEKLSQPLGISSRSFKSAKRKGSHIVSLLRRADRNGSYRAPSAKYLETLHCALLIQPSRSGVLLSYCMSYIHSLPLSRLSARPVKSRNVSSKLEVANIYSTRFGSSSFVWHGYTNSHLQSLC
jgi:hypothetical protein